MFILFRWWREIGEQPCVWSNFELRFIGCDVTHLLEVLSMGRLQALEQLYWVPCVRYDPDAPILDIIAENHAGIRTISLDMALDDFAERFEGYESDEMTKLATALVKFYVVDLTHCICTKTDATTFLRALLKASCGAISNLKAIQISGDEMDYADVLVEARLQGVEVTVVPAANDTSFKQPLDIIQIDGDGEEDNDEDVEKIRDFGKEGHEEGYKEEDRYEDGDTNKYNEDDGRENLFDLISLSLHKSSAHSDCRAVKAKEDGHLLVTINAPATTLTLPRITRLK